ncbi:hypothetical protein [Erythrobacter alti]|uniref:hypothetical protein n=1 Tax=Erythrobacter alti TaxID=1896145 RepID=UPI0030F48095
MSSNAESNNTPPTVLGYIIRAISLFAIAAMIAYLVFQIAKPPKDIELELSPQVDQAREQNGQTLLPVEIRNVGSSTIRTMDVELTAGSTTHEVSIPMLGESETVTVVVDAPAPDAEISYKILSYEAP